MMLDNDDLPFLEGFVGLIINKLLSDGDITQHQWLTCMKGAVAFYKASLRYVLKKMNLSGNLWEYCKLYHFFFLAQQS